jgi:hypothetical protein
MDHQDINSPPSIGDPLIGKSHMQICMFGRPEH